MTDMDMRDEDWQECLARSFDMHGSTLDTLELKVREQAGKFNASEVARHIAEQAFRLGMEQASLALA